jgi:predicted XRE-type DNA-binding protein
MDKKHIGSNFDDFLEDEGILAAVQAAAVKRVLAYQLEQLMLEQKLSKSEIARRMKTSRASVDRLLNGDSESATLLTLVKAAAAVGRTLQITLL